MAIAAPTACIAAPAPAAASAPPESATTAAPADPSNEPRRAGANKLRSFHRAAIPHDWVVDPANETLTVHRWHQEGYLVALTASRDDVVRPEPFEAIELPVGVIFGDEPA